MNPRLRLAASARPAARSELVQLGFLLPWAASQLHLHGRRHNSAGKRGHTSSAAAVRTRPEYQEQDEDVDFTACSGYNEQEQWNEAEIPHAESSAMAARRQACMASPAPLVPFATRHESTHHTRAESTPSTYPATTSFTSQQPPKPDASPSEVEVQSLSRRSTSTSFIREALSVPNPPPPADVLTFLRARSNSLTYAAGIMLAKYAERVDDQRALRGVWREMVSSRIAPLGAFKGFVHAQRSRRKSLGATSTQQKSPRSVSKTGEGAGAEEQDGLRVGQQEEGDGEGGQVIDGYFRSSERPAQRTYAVKRPNRWAMKMYPPLESIPRDFDTNMLLRHLHHLLLELAAPDFEHALEILMEAVRKAEASRASVGQNEGQETETAERETDWNRDQFAGRTAAMTNGGGGGDEAGAGSSCFHQNRRKVANGYDAMGLLNLYLAYLPFLRQTTNSVKGDQSTAGTAADLDPLDLIDTYIGYSGRGRANSQVFEPILNKQTLHLSVRALIDIAISRNTSPRSGTQASGDDTASSLPKSIPAELIKSGQSSSTRQRTAGPDTRLEGKRSNTSQKRTEVDHNGTPSPTMNLTPTPTISPTDINRLLATISHFRSTHNIHPGPETYRHLLIFALTHDLKKEVGEMAYEGWFRAFRDLRRRAERERAPVESGVVDGTAQQWSENVRFRFRRVGGIKRRWKRVLGLLVDKGWIRNLQYEEGEGEDQSDPGWVDEGVHGREGELVANANTNKATTAGLDWGYQWLGDEVEMGRPAITTKEPGMLEPTEAIQSDSAEKKEDSADDADKTKDKDKEVTLGGSGIGTHGFDVPSSSSVLTSSPSPSAYRSSPSPSPASAFGRIAYRNPLIVPRDANQFQLPPPLTTFNRPA